MTADPSEDLIHSVESASLLIRREFVVVGCRYVVAVGWVVAVELVAVELQVRSEPQAWSLQWEAPAPGPFASTPIRSTICARAATFTKHRLIET